MDFESCNGLRLRYWFTAGNVVSTRSWAYRGEWYYETWIRDDDGREWRSTGGLLGVAVNRGQRLAFAWCAANGSETGDLVALRNCTTGESRVVSRTIAAEYDRRAYGRWGMLLALIAAAIAWQGGYVADLPAIIAEHWVQSLLALTLSAGAIGFVLSAQFDPDPEREVDQKIQMALAAMEHAWDELQRQDMSGHRNGNGRNGGRSRSVNKAYGQECTASADAKRATMFPLLDA